MKPFIEKLKEDNGIKVPIKKQPLKTKLKEKRKTRVGRGQLMIDVYQTDSEIVIQASVTGVKPKDLDINIEDGIVIIEGIREEPKEDEKKEYLHQECYWGPFSRKVILSEEINSFRAKASLKQGILILRIPKIQARKKRKIIIHLVK